MKRIILPALILIGHGIAARCQDTTALRLVEKIAGRVIRDTRFSFRPASQQEELGMQVLDARFLAPRPGEQVYARRYIEAVTDTVVDIGIDGSCAFTVWINGHMIWESGQSSARPVEFAYNKFRFTRSFRASLHKGVNEWVVRLTAGNTQPVVFLRAQTRDGDQDSSVRTDHADQWMYAGPFPPGADRVARGADGAATGIDTERWTVKPFYQVDGHYFTWTRPPQRLLPTLEIDPAAAYRRESFADWLYPNGILLWTFLGLTDATGEEQYQQFVHKYAAFVQQYRPYFKTQYDSLNAFRGSYHRMFRRSMLDDAGAPTLPLLALYTREHDTSLLSIVAPMMDYVCHGQVRLPDSTFCRPEPEAFTVWADDFFMSTPFLLMAARTPGHSNAVDDVARQAVNFQKYLQDARTGLYHHGWYSRTRQQSPVCWGRANGWIAWATVELLDTLSSHHPLYKTILGNFRRHMRALADCQTPDGMWRQVLDDPTSYEETSCTAMFSLAMARGVRRRWLDRSYKEKALKAWQAVARRITSDGVVKGICRGTDMSADAAYYKNRATYDNDPRGLGAVIAAGIEIARSR
ncbi:MAG TPA: glycoside hydrolase family 88 protein [Puia sp.]|nr:glycoside hydrolase family 88 protein [Puia sp.]